MPIHELALLILRVIFNQTVAQIPFRSEFVLRVRVSCPYLSCSSTVSVFVKCVRYELFVIWHLTFLLLPPISNLFPLSDCITAALQDRLSLPSELPFRFFNDLKPLFSRLFTDQLVFGNLLEIRDCSRPVRSIRISPGNGPCD